MKPIIFSTSMVRAILAGNKTQTRRVIKPKHSNTNFEMRTDKYGTRLIEIETFIEGVHRVINDDRTTTLKVRPYIEPTPHYNIGDVLWVREKFRLMPPDLGSNEWEFFYEADGTFQSVAMPDSFKPMLYKPDRLRPSIHMPQAAARLFLKVTDVRCERLQDITASDVSAELGADFPEMSSDQIRRDEKRAQRKLFHNLWNSINAKRGFGWDANPWVWVYVFERTWIE